MQPQPHFLRQPHACDRKLSTLASAVPVDFQAQVVVMRDHYAFGMEMPGQQYAAGEYRYGFNGMERDDEVKGSGDWYDFGARMYDPRVGRWWSCDKMEGRYPSISTFIFVADNPIRSIDSDGNEIDLSGLSVSDREVYDALITKYEASDLFSTMYEALEKSETVIKIEFYDRNEKGQKLPQRAFGYHCKSSGTVGVSRGTSQGVNDFTVTQELFHAFQDLPENQDLYATTTCTDQEAEGEIATYLFTMEIHSKYWYIPMGGEVLEKGSNAVTVDSDFKKAAISSGHVATEQFNECYQNYKEKFVTYNSPDSFGGNDRPACYKGNYSNTPAVGIERLAELASKNDSSKRPKDN